MNDIVDDSSIADGFEPSSVSSNTKDETESLPNAVASPPHSPGSLRNTAHRSTLDIIAPAHGNIQPLKTNNNNISGEVNRIDTGNASQILQDRGVPVGQFSSKWPVADYDSLKWPKQKKGIRRRFKSPALEQSDFYTPPVSISNPLLSKKLIKIAQEFSFLDRFFADYFRFSKIAYDRNDIQQYLLDIRNDLAKRQRQSSRKGASQVVHIGHLGEWCEYVSSWSYITDMMKNSKESYKDDLKCREEYLVYLQSNLEIPYWQLVIHIILDCRHATLKTFGDGVLYMLRYKALSCRNKFEELDQIGALGTEDEEGLTILKRSIQKRLDILDRALEVEMLDEDLDLKTAAIQVVSGVHSEHGTGTQAVILQTTHDAPIQLAFFVLFIILAFIPGYQGFAISAKTHENGSTGDADFYYLMQSSIMSVLGNFANALPLLQSGRTARPLHFFWVFSALGLFSAVLSVVIYPLANTGWSSVVSFVGSVASAGSVLVLTMATAREQMSWPVLSRSHGEHPTKGYSDLNEKKKQ